jgi:hypothetical protein
LALEKEKKEGETEEWIFHSVFPGPEVIRAIVAISDNSQK